VFVYFLHFSGNKKCNIQGILMKSRLVCMSCYDKLSTCCAAARNLAITACGNCSTLNLDTVYS
jgi:hypothetical protein